VHWTLSRFSTQGNVINLALRAAGSITLTGVISDGFVSAAGGRGTTVTSLTNQPSGSFNIVAGADLSSANSLSVLSCSVCSLTLASGCHCSNRHRRHLAGGGRRRRFRER
jgi:hypothetical protein